MKGGAFFNGKEGWDDFRRTPSLTVRKDGKVFENFIMSLISCNYNSNKKVNVKAA